jgi:hypothetical protein
VSSEYIRGREGHRVEVSVDRWGSGHKVAGMSAMVTTIEFLAANIRPPSSSIPAISVTSPQSPLVSQIGVAESTGVKRAM